VRLYAEPRVLHARPLIAKPRSAIDSPRREPPMGKRRAKVKRQRLQDPDVSRQMLTTFPARGRSTMAKKKTPKQAEIEVKDMEMKKDLKAGSLSKTRKRIRAKRIRVKGVRVTRTK